MRLSESIRLGATMRPQIFNDLSSDKGTCALGAAREALGLTEPCDFLSNRFPLLENVMALCPECSWDLHERTLYAAIIHLNDTHKWTREQIADFVELHEPQAMLPESPTPDMLNDIETGHDLWLEGYAERV